MANASTRGTLTEGALAPLLGGLQRRRASGWLRISGVQLRGGIPSVVRLSLRLQEGRVVGVEAADDPLRSLPAGADLAERATHGLMRVLACRDAVQGWEPTTEAAPIDPAAPWLAALTLRAVERLADAVVVQSALGDPGRVLRAAARDDAASAALTQAQRALLTCVRGEVKAGDLIQTVGESAGRSLLALLCAGVVQWAADVEAPAPSPAPAAPLPAAAASPAAPRTKAPPAPAPAPAPAAAAPSSAAVRQEIEAAHATLRGATHFQILGLGVGASPDEVRQAFSRLARRYHPDTQRDPALQDLRQKLTDIFVAVSDSYGVLKDAPARERYERSLGLTTRPSTGASQAAAAAPRPPSSTVADPVEARLLGAEEALAAQQPWEAIRLLEEAIPAAAGTVKIRAQVLLGQAYAARDRPREAEKILLDVLQTDPRVVPACLLLGRLYRNRGMTKRANGMFERVLEVDPRNAEARRELGVPPDTPPAAPARGSLLSRLRDRH